LYFRHEKTGLEFLKNQLIGRPGWGKIAIAKNGDFLTTLRLRFLGGLPLASPDFEVWLDEILCHDRLEPSRIRLHI
jgi:hypothetical protein